MHFKVKHMAWLPNSHGFPFTAVMRDGSRTRCRVVKGPDGCYKVEGAVYADIAGWVE